MEKGMYDSSSDEDVTGAPHASNDGYKVYVSCESDDDETGSDDEYHHPSQTTEQERAQPIRVAKINVNAVLEPRVGRKFQVDVVPLVRWVPTASTFSEGHEQTEPLLVPTEEIAAELAQRAELHASGQVLERSTQEQNEYVDARYLSMGAARVLSPTGLSPTQGSPRAVTTTSGGGGSSSGVQKRLSSSTRGPSCGECTACLRDLCGTCHACLDKPRFGGPGTKKRRCVMRQCLNKPAAEGETGDGKSAIKSPAKPKPKRVTQASRLQPSKAQRAALQIVLGACELPADYSVRERSADLPPWPPAQAARGRRPSFRREPMTKSMIMARRGYPRMNQRLAPTLPPLSVTRLRRDDETEEEAPPPLPPGGWRWPREGDRIEIEAEEEEGTVWWPAAVTSVLVDGWFSAQMLHDDEWVDWFTWQEEGVDWRRSSASVKRKQSEGAGKGGGTEAGKEKVEEAGGMLAGGGEKSSAVRPPPTKRVRHDEPTEDFEARLARDGKKVKESTPRRSPSICREAHFTHYSLTSRAVSACVLLCSSRATSPPW